MNEDLNDTLAVSAAEQARSVNRTLRSAMRLFRPPPKITVAEWADKYRVIPRGVSAEPGRWKSSRLPYCREPMENLSVPGSETVLMIAAQLFKTETLINATGYYVDSDPSSILVVYPTLDTAKKWSQKRLASTVEVTPCLASKIKPPRARDSGNTILSKEFPGGNIVIAGANSPSSLRHLPVRVVLMDEVDAYKGSCGEEGDPCLLAQARAANYSDRVILWASTPTIKDFSRIESQFVQSDQRYWFCPCPKCGFYQHLKWSQVIWEHGEPATAKYKCESCNELLTDDERIRMILAGEWRPTAKPVHRKGYHMNGLYRIMGLQPQFKDYLHQFVAGFYEAKGDPERIKVWTNTFLAETFEIEGSKIEFGSIAGRCEHYGPELPPGVLVIITSADVQQDRIEVETIGFGKDEESWGIECRRFVGNTETEEPWRQLDEHLKKRYDHPCGITIPQACCVIDTGTKTKHVYAWARRNHFCRIICVKGLGTAGAAPVSRPYMNSARRVPLHLVGTNTLKDAVFERLKLTESGPRYMHFPIGYGYNEEYFLQLTAEKRIVEKYRGFPKVVWHKIRERNEALDIRVYALAALEILNPSWNKLAKAYAIPDFPKKKPESYSPENPSQTNLETPQQTEEKQAKPISVQNIPMRPKRLIIHRRWSGRY